MFCSQGAVNDDGKAHLRRLPSKPTAKHSKTRQVASDAAVVMRHT